MKYKNVRKTYLANNCFKRKLKLFNITKINYENENEMKILGFKDRKAFFHTV